MPWLSAACGIAPNQGSAPCARPGSRILTLWATRAVPQPALTPVSVFSITERVKVFAVHDKRRYIPRPRSVPDSSPPPFLRLRFLNLPLMLFEDTNKNVCLLPSLSGREGCSLRTRFSSKDKPQSSGHAPTSFQGVTATCPQHPLLPPPTPSRPQHCTAPPVPTDPPVPAGPLVLH